MSFPKEESSVAAPFLVGFLSLATVFNFGLVDFVLLVALSSLDQDLRKPFMIQTTRIMNEIPESSGSSKVNEWTGKVGPSTTASDF